jgi:hypothetical protein
MMLSRYIDTSSSIRNALATKLIKLALQIPNGSSISIPEEAGSEVCKQRKAEEVGVVFARLRFKRKNVN